MNGQWSVMASVLIDSGKYIDVPTCEFTDELSAVQFCQTDSLRDNIRKWLTKLNEPCERTVELTNKFRRKGNEYFKEITGENDLAADYYTKAIFSAPKDSVELSLAHANRAACSVTSDRFYEEGYFDCKLALQFNYPKDKLIKLFERKQFLANQTNKNEEYSAETYLEMKNMNIELDEERGNFLAQYQSKVQQNQHDINNDRVNAQSNVGFKDKNLIEKCDPSVGRYLVTEDVIRENERIYSEKAFSFVPAYNYERTDLNSYACQHCSQSNCMPFPCYDCVRASYCSPACVANHQPIHKYECVGYQKNLWIKLGVGYLAFRTFIVGFKDVVQMLEKKQSTVDEVWTTLMSEKHNEYPYGHVLRLVSHVDKVTVKNALRYALTAQLMTIYLSEYTDFFSNLPKICGEIMSNVEDWKTLANALILRHMGQAFFNSYIQSELVLKPPSVYNKSYGYGSNSIHLDDLHMVVSNATTFSAFFPKVSMTNHSCDPNIRLNVIGSLLTVYATRDINRNEELLNCYGPNYKLSSKVERQTQLKMEFLFDCKCYRCVSNDISYQKYYEYYCPNEECGSFVDLNEIDMRWWYYLNEDYCNQIERKFKCNACGTRLPMNPTMMRKFEKAAQGHIDNGYTYYSTDDSVITTHLLDLYFTSSKCLGAYHELKIRMAHIIFGYRILESKVEWFPRLAYITMENFVNRLDRYGMYSLEFILVFPYAFSILKMANCIEMTNTLPAMARDITKIRKILDLKKMEKSLILLPRSLQMVFKNIIRDIEFDGNSANQLMMERLSVSDRFNVSGSFNLTGSGACNSEKSVG